MRVSTRRPREPAAEGVASTEGRVITSAADLVAFLKRFHRHWRDDPSLDPAQLPADLPPGLATKEKPLPISKEALLGTWEGRSGMVTVEVEFLKAVAVIKVRKGDGKGPASRTTLVGEYSIDRKTNVFRIPDFGGGHLVKGGALQFNFTARLLLFLPRGAIITLSRPMRRD